MDTGLEKATFSRPPLFRGERYRIRRYMYTDTKTETGVGHDRSRPCAGQWRFTPVVRVGCHGNLSPYTYVARKGTYTCTRDAHSRVSPGQRGMTRVVGEANGGRAEGGEGGGIGGKGGVGGEGEVE